MKIEANSTNTTVTPADGGYHRSHRPDKTEQKKQLQGNTIQASLLHIKPEKADKEAIMEQANRKALKTLLSQFADDESTSQTMKDLSDRSMKNQADAVEYLNKAREQATREEAIKNQYDVDPDSEEQRNLDLLIKREDGEKLTDEETAILENMGPLTQYQEDYLYAHKEKRQYEEKATDAMRSSKICNDYIQSIKKELLKSHPMVDASKEAAEILANAVKDVVSQIVSDAQDYLDEKAEETKEKREEMEEEIQERKEELERKKAEDARRDEQLLEGEQLLNHLQKPIQSALQEADIEANMRLELEKQESMKGIKISDYM